MHNIQALKQRLERLRFLHLMLIAASALLVFLSTTLPHKWWILLTALIVSSGIQPGLIVRRAFYRVKGTMLALILLIPMLYLLQLNYRLIPIVSILSIIGLTVTTLNPERYDRTVFFTTLFAFFLTAQSDPGLSPEGPIEMVLNRGICTVIGAMIVLISDYFMFDSYQYSRQLYFLHQLMVYDFFKQQRRQLKTKNRKISNRFLFLERLRSECNALFVLINLSADNLYLELKAEAGMRQRINEFQATIWALRRLLFAISYGQLTLDSATAVESQMAEFNHLLDQARKQFIQV